MFQKYATSTGNTVLSPFIHDVQNILAVLLFFSHFVPQCGVYTFKISNLV